MKISKKELKEAWDAVKNPPFGWVIYCVYVYEYKGKLYSFVQYNGQGTLDVIYNSRVAYRSYSIEELFGGFTNCKDAVEYAKSLIESGWEE